jgi:hypothetical protein
MRSFFFLHFPYSFFFPSFFLLSSQVRVPPLEAAEARRPVRPRDRHTRQPPLGAEQPINNILTTFIIISISFIIAVTLYGFYAYADAHTNITVNL